MRELAPILLTSPAIRCGTTLLQRLLCSSSNALIYGEEIGKDLELQLQIFASRKMVYLHSRQRFASSLDRVTHGDTDDWIVDLMPDIDGYLEALRQGSFAGLSYCRQHALEAGRPLWGFKYPGCPPYLLNLLFDTIPATKLIYLDRDLADCARSAKAWKVVNNEAEMQHFCTGWLTNTRFMQQLQKSRSVLILSFEDLLKDPDGAIDKLGNFLPIENLKRDVLHKKINNLVEGSDTRLQHNGYIEPADLSPAEAHWIEQALALAKQSS